MKDGEAEARIKSRVRGRDLARELLDLLDPGDIDDKHFMASFVQEVIAHSGMQLEAKKKAREPGNFESLRTVVIEFGQYKGSLYDEVPLSYLHWLCGEREDDLLLLRGYLMHPQLKNHIRDYDRK